jgi:hypothetical protein
MARPEVVLSPHPRCIADVGAVGAFHGAHDGDGAGGAFHRGQVIGEEPDILL